MISGGACPDWVELKLAAGRQRELESLSEKIKLPNPKSLAKPKPPKKQTHPLFSVGDVLAVTLPDGQYGACVLVILDKTPRKIEYHFAVVNLFQSSLPSLDDVGNAEISYRGSFGFDASCWTNHKTLMEVSSSLQRIGQLGLTEYQMGTYSPGLGAEEFFKCWRKNSTGAHCVPMWDCIKSIVSEDARR